MASSTITDWRELPDGPEKYQRYLASREWSLLKEVCRKRCNGICERCHNAPVGNLHHETYIRKYHELPEDLAYWCWPCHKYHHAKRARDPRLDRPVKLLGRTIRSVYLAGKIRGHYWRNEILGADFDSDLNSEIPQEILNGDWDTIEGFAPLPDGRLIAYTGPYWCDLSEEGHCRQYNAISDKHAYGPLSSSRRDENGDRHHDAGCERKEFIDMIIRAIDGCDLFFAWIDSGDCYGTLVEIGLAKYADKLIVVTSPRGFDSGDHLWLAKNTGHVYLYAESAGAAWKSLWTSIFAS